MLDVSNNPPTIIITNTDLIRLQRYLSTDSHAATAVADTLSDELNRATVVASQDVSPDVVTMNSTVRCQNLDTGRERELTLVYPTDADLAQGRVSVLAPVGAALLGLSTGQEIAWPLPNGNQARFRVSDVIFQPEAAGRFDL